MPLPDGVSASPSEREAPGSHEAAHPLQATGPEAQRMLLAVGLVALLLRLVHTQSLLADPLFYVTLGGNAPYLEMAERIASGHILPGHAFTLNSPLYPYFVALIYKLFGVGSLFALRVTGDVFGAGVCALVALLSSRHFGIVAGWASGLVLAVYGPAIFFANELAPVSMGLFLLLVGILLLDGPPSARRFATAGLVLGLATGLRPNYVFAGAFALLVPWTRSLARPRPLALATAAGLLLGMAPVTVTNWIASGRFTLLTLSGGHNLYIGHNPYAQPQYTLPTALDGDVFETMKALAEDAEGRAMSPSEVSGYYTRKAVRGALAHPLREARLTASRALLLANDFEATTYSNPYYQRAYSPLLRWTPTFAWLFALALPGMIVASSRARERWHLWIPLLVGAVSVLLFFYIARLRVVIVPSLAIFAGVTIDELWRLRRGGLVRTEGGSADPRRRRIAWGAGLAVIAFGVAQIPMLRSDTSNEWNKAGGVLRVLKRYDAAEAALDRAEIANPANPNTFFNRAVLYREIGRTADADAAQTRGEVLSGAQGVSRGTYLEGLRDESR